MTWAVPNWYALILLALAAFRVFHLLAEDAILDRPREWVVARFGEKNEVYFLTCAYCLGAYISVAFWLFWVWQPHWSLVAATPFALSAVVALVASRAGE